MLQDFNTEKLPYNNTFQALILKADLREVKIELPISSNLLLEIVYSLKWKCSDVSAFWHCSSPDLLFSPLVILQLAVKWA